MLVPGIKEKKGWLSLILFVSVCLNLFFDFSYQGSLQERRTWIDEFFKKVFLPAQFVASSVQEGSRDVVTSFFSLVAAYNENKILLSELNQAKLDLHQLKELELENHRLRDLLGFKKAEPHDYLAAEVIGRDPHSFYQSLLLDRGSDDGVEVGMPVVGIDGVIGRIIDVRAFSSQVHLITDGNSRVDVVAQRSRTRAIAAGNLDGNSLNLRFLPRRQDLSVGDVLLTSGLGRNFPAGFKVGTITKLTENPNEVLGVAEVFPSVNFNSVEEVFIVRRFSGDKS